ncbi:MAG TPA: hypothetical protein VG276_11300 [Actinomycetes bacterium]|jgi:hypothetical protein|nr:hypothetical protein [Actinomycetes bacterium]
MSTTDMPHGTPPEAERMADDGTVPGRQPMPEPDGWDIDPTHSHLQFVARRGVARLRGRFRAFWGVVHIAATPGDSRVAATDSLDADRFPFLTFRIAVGVARERPALRDGRAS